MRWKGSLDDITSRFERSVLTQLYRLAIRYVNWRNGWGIAHRDLWLREYGLPSQKKGEGRKRPPDKAFL